jgi:hypothetical protein
VLEDKPYARQMERVTFHWSGKQRRVVQGIALMSLLRTQGQALLPCNFRVYDKPTRTGTFARCHKKQIAALSWHFHLRLGFASSS